MMIRLSWACLYTLMILLFTTAASSAFEVQEVISPKGIKAWLVEAHDIPILSLTFSIPGGRNFESPGKEGAHALMTEMLIEGAGTLSSDEFKAARTRMTSRVGFYGNGDYTSGYLSTLTKNRDATASLLKQALENPRFEEASFARLRERALQDAAQSKVDQSTIAEETWFALAFPGHLYGRTRQGKQESLKSLTTADLRRVWNATANRRELRVAVVGDITPADLSALLDKTFGGLPDQPVQIDTPVTAIAKGPIEKRIAYDGPQTVIHFGNPAYGGDNRKGWSSRVLAEILGGQASFARLTQTLREKSGLTYGVSFVDSSWRFAAVQIGSFATATATAEQALQLLKQEMTTLAAEGPTAEELRKIKSYMNGSYALRFSDNDSIANEMLFVMQRGHDVSYFMTRESKVNAVTLEDVRAAAAQLLKPENQILVIVGKQ